jgi:hypothetical protein
MRPAQLDQRDIRRATSSSIQPRALRRAAWEDGAEGDVHRISYARCAADDEGKGLGGTIARLTGENQPAIA